MHLHIAGAASLALLAYGMTHHNGGITAGLTENGSHNAMAISAGPSIALAALSHHPEMMLIRLAEGIMEQTSHADVPSRSMNYDQALNIVRQAGRACENQSPYQQSQGCIRFRQLVAYENQQLHYAKR
jgi:hypothetical protein